MDHTIVGSLFGTLHVANLFIGLEVNLKVNAMVFVQTWDFLVEIFPKISEEPDFWGDCRRVRMISPTRSPAEHPSTFRGWAGAIVQEQPEKGNQGAGMR